MKISTVCGRCGRSYLVNANGQLRRHWCAVRSRVETKRVALPDGGSISLTLHDANPLAWPASRRAAFFALVDALAAIEASLAEPPL